MTGQRVSHYEVADKIGEGGMGVVWKARDIHLERWVALKTLPAQFVADESRRTRFLREARAASALNHAHIVTIHDFIDAGGTYFLVMEHIEGKSLDCLIPRRGLRLPELLRIAIPAADALASAHKAGIVHRDVKPGNILVSNQGKVKVLDFGLAKRIDEIPLSEGETTRTCLQETEEGVAIGTVAYMSPEQAQGKAVDARSDIFSFGAMLYEMATGERAFQGDSKLSTLSAVLKDEPKPAADMPRELTKIISRCLRKDPERRLQSMADLRLALEELKEESESGAHLEQPAAAPHRIVRLAWLAIPIIAAIVASGFWLWKRRQAELQPQPIAFSPKPLTTYAGTESTPTLSPDGNQVAFSWDGESQDNVDIYVRLIAGGAPLRLTTARERDFAPAWSPDGASIAFLRTRSQATAGVYLTSPLGGAEREIGEAYVDLILGAGIAWTPDSKRVIIARKPEGEPRPSLFTLDVETREIALLISRPPDVYQDTQLTYSPDGRSFVFVRSRGSNAQELYFVSGGGEPKPLNRVEFSFGGLTWTPDSSEIVYSTPSEIQRLRVDEAGATPRTVAAIAGVQGLILSRSGRLVYSVNTFDTNLYLLDVDRPGSQARIIASSTRAESHPQISPDGSRIAFASDRSGAQEIWIAGVDGSTPTRLTALGGQAAHSPAWSPDGKRIAFSGLKSGNRDIYVIDANGGGLHRLTDDALEEGRPMWSRDGRFLYYYSLRGGRSNTLRLPVEGGQPVQITRNGGHRAWESPDGSSLFIEKAETPGLFRARLDGSGETMLLPDVLVGGCSLSRDGIFYVPRGDTLPLPILFHDLRTGAARQVGRIEKPVARQSNYLSASWDGKRLVWSQRDSSTADLMLVENFR